MKLHCGANNCLAEATQECPLCKLWVCAEHLEHDENKRGIQAH